MKETSEIEECGDGCYIKQRYVLCFLAFLGLCNVTFIRNHVGVTTLAMMETTVQNETQEITNNTNTKNLGWNNFQQGQFLAAYFYGYPLGNFPGGMLVNRFGFRRVLPFCIFTSAIFEVCIPMAACRSFYLAIALRALVGFSQGPCAPAMISIWSKWAPPFERSVLNSVALSGGLFGFLIILPAAGLIVDFLSWEVVFFFTGGLAMLWCCIFFYFVTETPETNPRISKKEKNFLLKTIQSSNDLPRKSKRSIPWKSIFASKCLYAHIVCHISDAWYQFAIPALFPTYMVKALNYNILESSFLMTLPFLLQMVFAVTGGHVTDFLRSKKIVSTTVIRKINSFSAIFLSGGLTVLSSYCDDGGAVIAIFTVGFAISGLSYAGYLSNSLDIAPNHAGVVFSISNTIAVSTGALAPLAAAFLVSDKTMRIQWQLFFWLTFGLSCVGSTTFAIFASGVQQKWDKIKSDDEETRSEKEIVDANLASLLHEK